jgi:hypothetical protein
MRALISGIIFCITTAGCVVSYAHALSWPARHPVVGAIFAGVVIGAGEQFGGRQPGRPRPACPGGNRQMV